MKILLMDETSLFKKPIGITNSRYWIKECPNNEADIMIMKFHYSKKSTKNRFKSFSVNDGLGYLQLGYGIRPHMKHTISNLITKDNYCEFDRMWLSDDLPKFAESQVISLLLSYLKQVYKFIKFVITYADESVGIKGTIYKATNAYEIEPVPVDFYVLANGERVHPVTMWHRHKTRAIETLKTIYPGIKHINTGFMQRRFLYILDKKVKRNYKGLK
jgi:hypothetical protein